MPVLSGSTYISGITTLPNRIRIREMDSRIGLYPTIGRTGDVSRAGNSNVIPFDDRGVLIFNNNVSNIMYGSLTTSGSKESLEPYAGNNNPNSGLSGVGSVIAGISDASLMTDYKSLSSKNNDNENIEFFDDSRVYLSDTTFFMTGSNPGLVTGFSSRLHDKTQIQIDLSPVEPTKFGNTTVLSGVTYSSSADNSADDTTGQTQQLMVYWNNTLKRWEKIAFGVHGNTVSSKNQSTLRTMIEEAAVGFGPIGYVATGSSSAFSDQVVLDQDALNGYARPTKNFGFPFDGKYHATSSQYITARDLGINQPFLLEKLQLRYDANIEFADPGKGTGDYNSISPQVAFPDFGNNEPSDRFLLSDTRFCIPTFFMMRQFPGKLDNFDINYSIETGAAIIDDKYTISIPGDFKLNTGSSATTRVSDIRELITYGQTTFYITSSDFSDLNFNPDTALERGIARDLTVDIAKVSRDFSWEPNTAIPVSTGSFVMNFPCRQTGIVAQNSYSYVVFDSSNQGTILMGDSLGGRGSGGVDSSSRSLVNVHPTQNPSTGSIFRIPSVDRSELPFEVKIAKKDSYDLFSPYLILPDDKLILGWQYPLTSNLQTGFSIDDEVFTNSMTLFGSSKLTLFGSQIKNNQEFHDTLNQPLTSEAVHEAIHYDNPVTDQFILGSRATYSGSYLDKSANNEGELSSIGDPVTSVVGLDSVTVLPASFQRFKRINNTNSVYYDTMVPDPIELWKYQTGISPVVSSSGDTILGFGLSGSAVDPTLRTVTANPNPMWFKSFVYDNSLGRVSFNSQVVNLKNTKFSFLDGELSSTSFTNGFDQFLTKFKDFNFNVHKTAPDNETGAVVILDDDKALKITKNNLMWLYGVGTGISGTLKGDRPSSSNGDYIVDQRPIGYKHGIMSVLPFGKSNVFRGDKFGNFADMLEQSVDARSFIPDTNTLTEGPVKINFVVAGEEAGNYTILSRDEISANTFNSSNLDLYATSSIPYFDDDITRNRVYQTADGGEATVTVRSDL